MGFRPPPPYPHTGPCPDCTWPAGTVPGPVRIGPRSRGPPRTGPPRISRCRCTGSRLPCPHNPGPGRTHTGCPFQRTDHPRMHRFSCSGCRRHKGPCCSCRRSLLKVRSFRPCRDSGHHNPGRSPRSFRGRTLRPPCRDPRGHTGSRRAGIPGSTPPLPGGSTICCRTRGRADPWPRCSRRRIGTPVERCQADPTEALLERP